MKRNPRGYTGKRWGDKGQYASKQEMQVSNRYPHLQFQPDIKIHYHVESFYLPDWRLGVDSETGLPVYVEGKEVFTTDMCYKYEAICDCNPGMFLLILTPRILYRDLRRMNAHPRIEVVVSHNEIPTYWFERTAHTKGGGENTEGGGGRPVREGETA